MTLKLKPETQSKIKVSLDRLNGSIDRWKRLSADVKDFRQLEVAVSLTQRSIEVARWSQYHRLTWDEECGAATAGKKVQQTYVFREEGTLLVGCTEDELTVKSWWRRNANDFVGEMDYGSEVVEIAGRRGDVIVVQAITRRPDFRFMFGFQPAVAA